MIVHSSTSAPSLGFSFWMLDLIKSFENKEIIDRLTLKEVVYLIRNPSDEHIQVINLARSVGKGNSLYRKLKSEVPCFIPNFTFKDNYVKGANVLESTGYLYIDVDGSLDINLSSEYIVAYWKSMSGMGYSIILSVSGVDKSNFANATVSISNDLGIPYDPKAISIDRNCIISYDENAFYTDNYSTYTYIEKVYETVESYNNNNRVATVTYSSKGNLITSTKSRLFDNIEFEGDVMTDLGSKVGYSTIGNKNIKIPEGKRNGSLFFMGCQLKALNPWLDFSRFSKYMNIVNKDGCTSPISQKELSVICKNVFGKFDKGELKVVLNKTCRFLFNPDYQLTPTQKRSYMMSFINKKRTEECIKKITDYIHDTGETNNSKISRGTGVARSSVVKYKKILGY